MSALIGWVAGDSYKSVRNHRLPVPYAYSLQGRLFLHQRLPDSVQDMRDLPALYRYQCVARRLLMFWDLTLERQTVIVIQRIIYGNAPLNSTLLPMEDDLEEALALSEE